MFRKLAARWQVNGLNLVLIIATFALGGSLCGYLGRKLLGYSNIDRGFLYIILYIILITLLWPVCVLLISIPLGQFNFFKKYITRIWNKLRGKRLLQKRPVQIAIFASGAGSNTQKLIDRFRASALIKISLVVCNKPDAGVLAIAVKEAIPTLIIEREQFFKGDHYVQALKEYGIDLLVLAGFLWKIPPALVQAYPKKIINIHPALLPGYGGKGMYGDRVHEAVIAAGDKESGISIHYVDELYDHGALIFQARCIVEPNDTAATLAAKVHALEHEHFGRTLASLIKAKA